MKGIGSLLAFALAGCSGNGDSGDVDTRFDALMASQTLASLPFNLEGKTVRAVCGPGKGKVLSGDDGYNEWQDDGITKGRLVFVSGQMDKGPDVVFRGALGDYVSSVDDGGVVNVYRPAKPLGAMAWTIVFPATGITETHNFVQRSGRLVDLWTTNKPHSALGVPSVRIFVSECEQP